MSQGTSDATEATFDRRLAFLLAMAMFVLVVDTSLMNVSISAVVHDLGTTVSGVQSASALEAHAAARSGTNGVRRRGPRLTRRRLLDPRTTVRLRRPRSR